MSQVLVFGAGSWGTALAIQLTRANHDVKLHSWSREHNQKMIDTHANHDYLPDIDFPDKLTAVLDWREHIHDCQDILIVVPSHGFADLITKIRPDISTQGLISATKGFCHQTLQSLDQIIADELPGKHFGIITGPSFAKEVARGLPTAILAASGEIHFARHIQKLFTTDRFRAYSSTDIRGAEIGGAIKNVLAIATGISDGLGYGANARAGLITRGLNEMMRLGMAMGGQKETFFGLSGLGDLVLTCTDHQSRNYRFGQLVGQGKTSNEAVNEIRQVVEGIYSAQTVQALTQKYRLELPICQMVYEILYNSKPIKQAAYELLTRQLKTEIT
ncbi:MAG: NAD(P)H-dependent glycerol-3-phosphate dehydrogenase [Francisellaceae bacterium]